MKTLREKRSYRAFWVVSALAVGLVMVMPGRYLFFLHGLPRLQFACPLLIAVAAVAWLWCAVTGRISRDWFAAAKRCWPVVALTLFDLAFLVFAYLTRKANPLVETLPPGRWWANYFLLTLSMPAALLLGVVNRKAGNRKIGIALLVILGVAFVVAAAEYLHLSGHHNIIGGWLLNLNTKTGHLYPVWQWAPPEAVRAQGLNSNPNCFAFVAAIGACWAVASRGMRSLRMSVLLLSIGCILISGTRSVLFSLLCVGAVFVIIQLRAHTFGSWLRTHRSLLLITVGGILILAATFAVTGGGVFPSVSRSVDTVTTLATESEAKTSDNTQASSDITSGRTVRWKNALISIIHHPLGTGQPYPLTTRQAHAHNDILNRLMTGGPLSALLYCAVLFWFLFCLATPEAPRFGVYIGIFMLVTGLIDSLFVNYPFVQPVLFIAGVLASKDWLTGKIAFTRKGRREQLALGRPIQKGDDHG